MRVVSRDMVRKFIALGIRGHWPPWDGIEIKKLHISRYLTRVLRMEQYGATTTPIPATLRARIGGQAPAINRKSEHCEIKEFRSEIRPILRQVFPGAELRCVMKRSRGTVTPTLTWWGSARPASALSVRRQDVPPHQPRSSNTARQRPNHWSVLSSNRSSPPPRSFGAQSAYTL